MDSRDCQSCPGRGRCFVKGRRTRTFIHTAAERRRGERYRVEQDLTWRERYAKRAGIEGLMSRLKRCTGLGRLLVRGRPAVFNAIYLKLAGWDLLQAAKAKAMHEILASRAAAAYSPFNPIHIRLKNALWTLLCAHGKALGRLCAA